MENLNDVINNGNGIPKGKIHYIEGISSSGITWADYWCFVTDNDGHWYKIPVSKKPEFEDWCECEENGFEHDYPDYDNFRSMHPLNYMFKINELKVLKESKNEN